MAFKTYVLLDSMNPPNSSIFKRISKTQRQQINKLPQYRPFLQVTITGKDGKSKTIRYKENSDTIFQDDQIKNGIPANERFTTTERRLPTFYNGVLATSSETLQKYLEAYPAFQGNENKSPVVARKEYELFDKKVGIKSALAATKERVEAVTKILALDLGGTKDLLYRFFGSAYVPTNDVEENQQILIDQLDEFDEATTEVLKVKATTDDEATILLGKALTEGVLSFDINVGQVSKNKGGKWIDVKAISSEHTPEERKRLFVEFITSDAGKLLYDDIEKDLKKVSKP